MKFNMGKILRLLKEVRTKAAGFFRECASLLALLREGKFEDFLGRLRSKLQLFKKPRIGDLLLKRDLILPEQIEEALKIQKVQGGFLGQILINLGYITEEDVIRALTVQQKFPYFEVGIVAVAIFIFFLFSSWVWQKAQVRFYTVTEKEISSTIVVNGVVEAEQEARVGSTMMGRVAEVKVEEGQEVKKGEVLMVLETQHLEAELEQMKARMEEAEKDLNRSQRLHESEVITTRDLDAIETQHRIARANVELLETRVKDSSIISPVDGTVVRVGIKKGEVAGPGKPLFKVIDLRDLLAVVKVEETQVESISIGGSATLYLDAFPGKSLYGKIIEIDRASAESLEISLLKEEEDIKRFRVKIAVLKPFKGIKAGMTAWAYIPCKRTTLVIPKRAIIRENNVSMVWKKDNGELILTKIKTGMEDEHFAQVLRGLKEGDVIQSRGFRKP